MSATPRTDAASQECDPDTISVTAEFSRTLERELAQAREVMTNLSQDCELLRVELQQLTDTNRHLQEKLDERNRQLDKP